MSPLHNCQIFLERRTLIMPIQTVDFKFKRGNKAGLGNLGIEDGSLIFTVDTEEFYVDIDDHRLTINGVVFYNTETEIKALTNPADKIYVAKNTRRILAYDKTNSKWIYLSSSGTAFGFCNSEAASQIKEVTLTEDFVLETGAIVVVKFANTNTFDSSVSTTIKLNVAGTGAKNIYYNNTAYPTGTNPTAFGTANMLIEYMYDGEYWVWMGCSRDANTTYENLTAGEIKTGTEEIGKLVTAKTFKQALDNCIWEGTKAQYDALTEIDPEVVYYIK